MNRSHFENIEKLIEKGELAQAENILKKDGAAETVQYLLLLGKIKRKQQLWGEAINAYQKVISMEENNKEAKLQIHIIRNILNFHNPEMFNP